MTYLLFGIVALLSWVVQNGLNRRFQKYAQIPTNYGMTGKEVAEKMLRDNGIYDVAVISAQGHLTDHYNPASKTVNLSQHVYAGSNIAAAAVAAHECGHAVQHATAYSFLTVRSKLVPTVNFASKWVTWVLLAGILLVNSFPQLLLCGIALFAITTLFSFVTLPVEINASSRAMAWLNSAGITSVESYGKARDALKWAAYTYVVAALSSLGTLFYYITIYLNRNKN
jgi:Zn-dependent membrane protease YugP